MTVGWSVPAANGDPVSAYMLTTYRGGTAVNSVEVTGTSQAVSVPTSESDYTFTVAAKNKAGYGEASAPSAPRRAFNKPDAPTGVTASEGDNTMTISFTPGALNGATTGEVDYQYMLNGNGTWISIPAGGGTVTAKNNGTYTAQVRAVTSADGSTYSSDASASSNAVAPYGAPSAPGTSASGGDRQVSFSWSDPGRNGRDYRVQITPAADGRMSRPADRRRSAPATAIRSVSAPARSTRPAPSRTAPTAARPPIRSRSAPLSRSRRAVTPRVKTGAPAPRAAT